MILKFKYHSDNGLLEAYQSYILAQNSSLVDSVSVTSTADDADKYDYCLEFVCYNSKNIPKAQYISPILKYDNGITFTLPNNLTEYKGHVDMQLTGYDPADNSVVFKSIGKNCKAFDVEGSLNVLESDLGETPNVLTEVMQQLEQLKNVREDIMLDARKQFGEVCEEYFKGKELCRVRFYVFNDLLKEIYVPVGSTCTAPENVDIPSGCVSDGKWYDSEELLEYSPELEIRKNHDFIYNFWNDFLIFEDGLVVGETKDESHSSRDIYIPEAYEGVRITGFKTGENGKIDLPVFCNINLPSCMGEGVSDCYKIPYVARYKVQCCNKILCTDATGALYSTDYQILLSFPSYSYETEYVVNSNTSIILSYAFSNCTQLKKVVLPESVREIRAYAFSFDQALKWLNIPRGINIIQTNAVYRTGLEKLYLDGDCSALITRETFEQSDEEKLTMMCPIEYMYNYMNAWVVAGIPYEMQGREALDLTYVKIDYTGGGE